MFLFAKSIHSRANYSTAATGTQVLGDKKSPDIHSRLRNFIPNATNLAINGSAAQNFGDIIPTAANSTANGSTAQNFGDIIPTAANPTANDSAAQISVDKKSPDVDSEPWNFIRAEIIFCSVGRILRAGF